MLYFLCLLLSISILTVSLALRYIARLINERIDRVKEDLSELEALEDIHYGRIREVKYIQEIHEKRLKALVEYLKLESKIIPCSPEKLVYKKKGQK